MALTNALTLTKQLSIGMGDWVQEQVTTNIAAGNIVTSTTLQQWDRGRDGYFNDWWLYIEDFLNAGVERRVRDYYANNGACNVYGPALTADASNTQTVRLGRYRYTDKLQALNEAVKEVYPTLYQEVVNSKMLTVLDVHEYALPTALADGDLRFIEINTVNASTVQMQGWSTVYGWDLLPDGTDVWIRLPYVYPANTLMRFGGMTPLSTMTNATDTTEIDENKSDLLVAYAKYKFYQKADQPLSADDRSAYQTEAARAYGQYKELLPRKRMTSQPGPMRL